MLPACHKRNRTHLCLHVSALALIGALVTPALAQTAAPSDDLSVNMVRQMVAQHIITQKQADAIIAKAQAETALARATHPVPAAVPAPQPAPAEPLPAGAIRAPYIPDNVREDIERHVRDKVVAEEAAKGYARKQPWWVERFTPFADFRFRDESHYFDKNNFYGFVNGNTFNSSGPVDINSGAFPIQNSLKNRNLLQFRARLGFDFEINDDVHTTFMVASGNNNGPISTIQDLGSDFGKKQLWLDQAYLTWTPSFVPGVTAWFGRFPNPFHSSEILFKQDDFQLDGVAVNYTHDIPWVSGLSAYVTGGAFPIQFSTDDFPTTAVSTIKTADKEKWLFGGQVGATWRVLPRLTENFNVGYYNFTNMQNSPSSCQYTDFYCFSQNDQPGFMQKGNTLLYLMPQDTNPTTGAAPQYLGLASKFEELDFFEKLDFAATEKTHITLFGEFTKNLGFSANQILTNAGGIGNLATNTETCAANAGETLPAGAGCSDIDPSTGNPYGHNVFKSGNTAWMARLSVGAPTIKERWDWALTGGYLYIEPDAVVDAFDDKDFRLGGTNSKGFIIQADLGVARNTWFTVKWLSADAISGPPLSVDNLQVDLNARF